MYPDREGGTDILSPQPDDGNATRAERPLPPLLRRLLIYGLPALALATLYTMKWMHAEEASGRRVGFSLDESQAAVVIREIVPDLPAARAGMGQGDRLLEVDGRAIHRGVDYGQAASEFRRGRTVVVVVDRGAQRVELALLPGVEPPWRDLVIDVVGAAAYLALALLAIGRAGRDVRLRLLYLYSLAVEAEIVLPYDPVTTTTIGLASELAFLLLTGFQMGTDLHMASLIPDRPVWLRRRRWVVPAYYAVGGALAGASALAVWVESRGGSLPWTYTQSAFVQLDLGLPLWAAAVGGLLTSRLVRQGGLRQGNDGARVNPPPGRLVVATDCHVITPLFYPGGDIGALSVLGTINDVAMMGATPLLLAAGFVLEEGFPLADLKRIVHSMAAASREAGLPIVTGDTKVVEKGKGDGVFITTTGVGVVADGSSSAATARGRAIGCSSPARSATPASRSCRCGRTCPSR